jgi:hypothetical protein
VDTSNFHDLIVCGERFRSYCRRVSPGKETEKVCDAFDRELCEFVEKSCPSLLWMLPLSAEDYSTAEEVLLNLGIKESQSETRSRTFLNLSRLCCHAKSGVEKERIDKNFADPKLERSVHLTFRNYQREIREKLSKIFPTDDVDVNKKIETFLNTSAPLSPADLITLYFLSAFWRIDEGSAVQHLLIALDICEMSVSLDPLSSPLLDYVVSLFYQQIQWDDMAEHAPRGDTLLQQFLFENCFIWQVVDLCKSNEILRSASFFEDFVRRFLIHLESEISKSKSTSIRHLKMTLSSQLSAYLTPSSLPTPATLSPSLSSTSLFSS